MKAITVPVTTAFILNSIRGSLSFSNSLLKIKKELPSSSHRTQRAQHAFLKLQVNDFNDNAAEVNEATNGDGIGFNQLKISFVTGNKMKATELNLILAEEQATRGPNPETSLVDLKIVNVDLPEIQEVNTEAIAKNKAILGAQLVGGPCVVEDTSLQFNALGGMVSLS